MGSLPRAPRFADSKAVPREPERTVKGEHGPQISDGSYILSRANREAITQYSPGFQPWVRQGSYPP
jgi:hypothetical protein